MITFFSCTLYSTRVINKIKKALIKSARARHWHNSTENQILSRKMFITSTWRILMYFGSTLAPSLTTTTGLQANPLWTNTKLVASQLDRSYQSNKKTKTLPCNPDIGRSKHGEYNHQFTAMVPVNCKQSMARKNKKVFFRLCSDTADWS